MKKMTKMTKMTTKYNDKFFIWNDLNKRKEQTAPKKLDENLIL